MHRAGYRTCLLIVATALLSGCATWPGMDSQKSLDEVVDKPIAKTETDPAKPPVESNPLRSASQPDTTVTAKPDRDEYLPFVALLDRLKASGTMTAAEREDNLATYLEMKPALRPTFYVSLTALLMKRRHNDQHNERPPPVATTETPKRPIVEARHHMPRERPVPATATSVAVSKPIPPEPTAQPTRYDTPQLTPQVATAWEGSLAATIRSLESQTRQAPKKPGDLSTHAKLRLLYLAAGRRDEAIAPLPYVKPGDEQLATHQEFLQSQMFGLSAYLRHEDDPRTPANVKLTDATARLREAVDSLSQLGSLTVSSVNLCQQVDDFGVYTPFPADQLQPGVQVMLYGEVENFTSQPNTKGDLFKTALKSSYQIFDAQGREVAKGSFKTITDNCRNRRRDFFVRYFLDLPERMYPGEHTLTLTVEDTLGQAIGQGTYQFTVRPDSPPEPK
jgi:hypothetical protein